MSIRLIAQDLYRLIREVAALEQRLASAPMENRATIEEKLRKTKAERDRLQRALDGKKG